MKQGIERLVLETINNTGSMMPLFKTGYAYSQILLWCDELEKKGLIEWKDEIRILTELGIERLKELTINPKKTALLINPLAQYRNVKMGIEDIYLP